MKLPPLFLSRPPAEQLIVGIVIPVVFGIVTGIVLALNEIGYWLLAGPIAIIGGFLGGMEHRGADEGFLRGGAGGLLFGSFVLIGLEIMNREPKAYLAEPQVGLVFATVFFGCILGALGGNYRVRQERRSEAAAAGRA
jgi:hypothetical protein